MAGISDGNNADDVKLHLEMLVQGDDERRAVHEGETQDQRERRESALFRPALRARIEKVLEEVDGQAPGLTSAEAAKLLKTRAGRDALTAGREALGRVDDHLQSVLEARNPIEGKRYGVFGANPTSFNGVARALALSVRENARVAALGESDPARALVFSAFVEREVRTAEATLAGVMGERLRLRADLSREVSLKDETAKEARTVLSAARQHLYANLPDRKQDDDLRRYGFEPVFPGVHGRGAKEEPGAPEEKKEPKGEPKPEPVGPAKE